MRMFLAVLLAAATAQAAAFQTLAPGMEIAHLRLPHRSKLGDSTLTVVRVDLHRRKLVLYGTAQGERPKTARAWMGEHHLLAAINAGMFRPDGHTLSFARTQGAVFNGTHSKEHDELVFDPKHPSLSAVRLLDDACDDRAKIEPRYASALQSIRMLDCHGRVRWSAQPKRWSVAALAIDKQGRVLLLHCRSPYPMREFISMLKALPLGIARMMYLEGGPEATLAVREGGMVLDFVGSYETGFNENDTNHAEWELPNVLGVK